MEITSIKIWALTFELRFIYQKPYKLIFIFMTIVLLTPEFNSLFWNLFPLFNQYKLSLTFLSIFTTVALIKNQKCENYFIIEFC
ncbi:hypothetical protein DBX26_24345 [Vibrio sp. dhg]|nr:hypothetical protein DBX26_24345 [Vibrio sp. dhg]